MNKYLHITTVGLNGKPECLTFRAEDIRAVLDGEEGKRVHAVGATSNEALVRMRMSNEA